MKRTTLALCALLTASLSLPQSIPELFTKAKDEVKGESWANAMTTLDALEAEAARPGNEGVRKQLEAPLAFYRGVCRANLDQRDAAVESFAAFLELQPNAELDRTAYSKKAAAAFEKARKAASSSAPSLAKAYKEFQPSAETRERPATDPLWAEGPVKYILAPEEKAAWAALADGNARAAFVEAYWTARGPAPGETGRTWRQEFERRVAFADANLAEDAEQRGSLTDRGMVFVLLGPPTYAGRKPLRTGDDQSISDGTSTVGSQDANIAQRGMSPSASSAKRATTSAKFGGPGKNALDSSNNFMEVWHYRRELLPAGVPYHQVDFEFLTKSGYGVNVLQRESQTVNALEAARSAARRPPSQGGS